MTVFSLKKNATRRNSEGYTLIEVLMAMSIVCIGLLAVGGMQLHAMRANQSARKTTEANDLATLTMERLINTPYHDPDLDIGSHGDPESMDSHNFNITWTVKDGPAVQTKKIRVTVAYPDRVEKRTVSLDFLKSNPNPFLP